MKLPKLEEPTLLADQVYATLHQAIINGELAPGTQLKVRDVAAQVGTSVTPVREAIRRLEESGFAARQPHKGAVVIGLTLEDLAEVYAVRHVLEDVAARAGAIAATPQTCKAMQAELKLLRTALSEGRMVDYLDHDERLLTALYEAGGNSVLLDLTKSLWQRCRAYKIAGVESASPKDPLLWKYQAELLEAAKTNDGDAAAAASHASIAAAIGRISAQLDEQRRATTH